MQVFAQQLKKWFADPVESIFAQVPRALVASGLAAIIDMGLLIFLVEGLGWHPAAAAVVGYLAGGVLQYILCSIWVFPNAPKSAATGFLAFTVLSLVGLAITWLTVVLLFDWAGIHYSLAKIVALGLAFSWNFLSRKYLLFRSESATQLLPALKCPEAETGEPDTPNETTGRMPRRKVAAVNLTSPKEFATR